MGLLDICLELLWTHLGPCFLRAYDLIGNKTDRHTTKPSLKIPCGSCPTVRTLRAGGGPGVCRVGKEEFREMVGLGKWASAESRVGSGQWQERELRGGEV